MSFTYASNVITQANAAGKSITAVASVTGGIRVTVSSHGYTNGDLIQITGTTNYDGAWFISNVATNTFDIVNQKFTSGITLVFGVTRTGTAAKGDKDCSGMSGLGSAIVTEEGVSYLAGTLQINGTMYQDRNIAFDKIATGASSIWLVGNNDLNDNFKDFISTFTVKPVSSGWTSGGGVLPQGFYNLRNCAFRSADAALSSSQGNLWGYYGLTGVGNGTRRRIENCYFVGPPGRVGASMFVPEAIIDGLYTYDMDFVYIEANPVSTRNIEIANSDWGLAQVDKPNIRIDASSFGRATIQGNISGGSDAFFDLYDVSITERYMWRYYISLGSGYNLYKTIVPIAAGNNKSGIDFYIYDRDGNELVSETTDANGSIGAHEINWLSFTRTSMGKTEAIDATAINTNPDDVKNYETAANIQGFINADTTSKFTKIETPMKFCAVSYLTNIITQIIASFDTLSSEYVNNTSIIAIPVTDASIKQSIRATVDAYTELQTSEKFYDRAKSYLCGNFTGQPSTLVSRSGIEIDLGAYDLDINKTASVAFALSGNKITIKADTFIGNLVTTGTITLLNGASVSGSVTDSTGTWPTQYTLTLLNVVVGSDVVVYNADLSSTGDGSNVIQTQNEVTSTTVYVNYTYTANINASIGLFKPGYVPQIITGVVLGAGNNALPVSQVVDRNYQ